MLLHCLVRIGILLAYFVEFRLENSHFCAAQITLLLSWEDEYLDDDCQEQQDDAHRQTECFEPVEDVKDRPTINEAEYPPTEIDEFVEVGIRAVSSHLAVCLEDMEVVRAEIHLQMSGVFACHIERNLRRCLVTLQVTFFIFNLFGCQ